jgi:hypothetical protein
MGYFIIATYFVYVEAKHPWKPAVSIIDILPPHLDLFVGK